MPTYPCMSRPELSLGYHAMPSSSVHWSGRVEQRHVPVSKTPASGTIESGEVTGLPSEQTHAWRSRPLPRASLRRSHWSWRGLEQSQ